jgi:hypothetical protein
MNGSEMNAQQFVRDPHANRAAVIDARRRPMSERLELALNWNKLASELQIGLRESIQPRESSR